jgi:hypothetical protein
MERSRVRAEGEGSGAYLETPGIRGIADTAASAGRMRARADACAREKTTRPLGWA